MWCEKCHYGAEHIKFTTNNDEFNCPQCRGVRKTTNTNPFKDKHRTLHGPKRK